MLMLGQKDLDKKWTEKWKLEFWGMKISPSQPSTLNSLSALEEFLKTLSSFKASKPKKNAKNLWLQSHVSNVDHASHFPQ